MYDSRPDDSTDPGDALRWKLRALRRDEAPGRDLWAGIAAALTAQRHPPAERRRPWLAPAAMAASLLLVVGVLGWQQATRAPFVSPPETLVQREADGMIRQYQAALQEVTPVSPAGSLQPTIAGLDRDVALIRDALEQAPNSRLLLEQLRRTYAHRLALAQRVAYS